MSAPCLAPLPPHLQRLLDAEYPRFSDAEMARRRTAMEAVLAEAGCDHLVFYGANRAGSSVQWLTQWPVTTEAVGVLSPGKPDALFVQYVNHAPLARKLADKAEIVEWGGESSIRKAIAALEKRGARENKVAVIGPMNFDAHAALAARFGKVTSLNRAYVKLRRVKSAEELDWFRIGAWLSDRGMEGLRNAISAGRERARARQRRRARLCRARRHHRHPFHRHDADARPAGRRRRRSFIPRGAWQTGDIVFSEITATFWDHSGQVLRSFTVGEEPTPLYRDLHAAADAAFDAIVKVLRHGATPAQVIEASGVIEDAGFTVIDDILHGYGGGYFPPILGTRSRPGGPVPEEPFEAGMMVVVQPNVATRDGKAGVQTGEMPADHAGRHRADARLSAGI